MVWLEKCIGPDIKKIRANRSLPNSTMGGAAPGVGLDDCDRAGMVEELSI
jgi:hypothetical protein